ncbi:MAG: RNA polymerase sigma factor [Calditrichia bacterium]
MATESDLLYQIQCGDHTAEREIFRRYEVLSRVETMVHSRIRAPLSDRNDLIGEILLSILLSLRKGKFDPARGEIGSYIWGIARNKIRDYLKPTPNRYMLSLIEEILVEDERDKEIQERRGRLKLALAKLDNKYRQVIFMRYYEEFTIEDMARKLQLEPSQVYNRIHYSISLIREIVKK